MLHLFQANEMNRRQASIKNAPAAFRRGFSPKAAKARLMRRLQNQSAGMKYAPRNPLTAVNPSSKP